MADPVEALAAVASKYGPTAIGLTIGTAAKYGLTLTEGRKLTWRGVIADMLLLGMLGLIAILIADWFNLAGNARVLAGALAAVSSDRLVRLVREGFMRRVSLGIDEALTPSSPAVASVPAGTRGSPATSTTSMASRSGDPRTMPIEQLGDRPLAPPDPELDALLGQIIVPEEKP